MRILENIHSHEDLTRLTAQQRETLCKEIREFLVANVSKTGGHLASNLGVVELTVALETVFDTQKDRLVFDVGHQSYVHKMLTGRQADFATLRQFGGIAGFPKPAESITDAFVAGHASSSVSIALGMARARTLMGEDYNVVAVMGDGAATGGMAYEGLNDASVSGEPMIVILNDNAMSIDNIVGGMASHLRDLRTKERYLGMKQRSKRILQKVPGGGILYRIIHSVKDKLRRMLIPVTIFESMGFTYLGPVDGHDTEHLIYLLQIAREKKRPVVLHIMTRKGKGYAPAQEHPKLFHGVGKFDPQTGVPEKKDSPAFSDHFGKKLLELAHKDQRICAITAAMPGGTGLLDFKKELPKRLFDVGIAEEHAVSMAGGLAKQGMVPVVAVYSTFLQRAYDMILQDICMLKLHVVFAVDRAGLVGEDGETHHGVFDVGFLRQAPKMEILCPASLTELEDMLTWAVNVCEGPVAIRYPRGGVSGYSLSGWQKPFLDNGTAICHRRGRDAAILTYGTLVNNALDAAHILEDHGIETTVIRLMSLSELPIAQVLKMCEDIPYLLVAEETCTGSGIREALAFMINKERSDLLVDGADLGKNYVPHGSVNTLYAHYGLDAQSLANRVLEVCKRES